jgi:hypothetical protein
VSLSSEKGRLVCGPITFYKQYLSNNPRAFPRGMQGWFFMNMLKTHISVCSEGGSFLRL